MIVRICPKREIFIRSLTASLIPPVSNIVKSTSKCVGIDLESSLFYDSFGFLLSRLLTAGLMKPGIYRSGILRNRKVSHSPTDDFPVAMRASFTRVINDPKTGAEHDVPKTSSNSPVTLYSRYKCIQRNSITSAATIRFNSRNDIVCTDVKS